MTHLTKEFSIKSPSALLWKCGLSHSEVITLLHNGAIAADWLICPYGEAHHAKAIAELPIDDLEAVRKLLKQRRNLPHTHLQPTMTDMQKFDALERLGKLKEQGLLTDEEFSQEKTKLLNAPTVSSVHQKVSAPQGTAQEFQFHAAPNIGGVSPAVIICGYIFALLFSVIGLILGIVALYSGSLEQKRHGIAITAISAGWMLFSLLLVL